jgi:tRNA-binding protein
MNQVSYKDFLQVEIRSGTIIEVSDFPEAHNPAYKIVVDFWKEIGIKKTSAQVTNYTKKDLLWKQILWVVNLPPKQVWKYMSEFLLTAFVDGKGIAILAVSDSGVKNWEKLL